MNFIFFSFQEVNQDDDSIVMTTMVQEEMQFLKLNIQTLFRNLHRNNFFLFPLHCIITSVLHLFFFSALSVLLDTRQSQVPSLFGVKAIQGTSPLNVLVPHVHFPKQIHFEYCPDNLYYNYSSTCSVFQYRPGDVQCCYCNQNVSVLFLLWKELYVQCTCIHWNYMYIMQCLYMYVNLILCVPR